MLKIAVLEGGVTVEVTHNGVDFTLTGYYEPPELGGREGGQQTEPNFPAYFEIEGIYIDDYNLSDMMGDNTYQTLADLAAAKLSQPPEKDDPND